MVRIESHMHGLWRDGENGDGRGPGWTEGSSSTTTPPSLGLAPLFTLHPPQPASVCVDCYPTLAAQPSFHCPISMLPATSRPDHSSRRRAPRCAETHALPPIFSALSYAVAARLDSPRSTLFESCEASHAPSHPLPLRRDHDSARPLRKSPDSRLGTVVVVPPADTRGTPTSSQLAARSPQPTATLAFRRPADPSDSSGEATR